MHVIRFLDWDQLRPWASAWNALAGGVPFRGWEWNTAWWNVYGQSNGCAELCTLGVFDSDGQAVGFAPWYIQQSNRQGRLLRFIGSGEVCTDYLGILALPGSAKGVSEALADWLIDGNAGPSQSAGKVWDVLELSSIDAQDAVVGALVDELAVRDCVAHRRSAQRCWRIALPKTWQEYLQSLSKSHRKQIRRLERRYFATSRAVLRTAHSPEELIRGQLLLNQLHARRRGMFGERGCFASTSFRRFHECVMPQLLATGKLRLHWLEFDGQPVAAEYHLADGGCVYAYQSGLEPSALRAEPGRLAAIATLQLAIREGHRSFDFLRGDEAYKAHFRAMPREMWDFHVTRSAASSRWRNGVSSARNCFKHWLTGELHLSLASH